MCLWCFLLACTQQVCQVYAPLSALFVHGLKRWLRMGLCSYCSSNRTSQAVLLQYEYLPIRYLW